jgi:hypothetical protein
MKPAVLIKALKTVPETRLKLIDLAWKIYDENGNFEEESIIKYHKELVEASEEAKAYSERTRRVVGWMKTNLMGH